MTHDSNLIAHPSNSLVFPLRLEFLKENICESTITYVDGNNKCSVVTERRPDRYWTATPHSHRNKRLTRHIQKLQNKPKSKHIKLTAHTAHHIHVPARRHESLKGSQDRRRCQSLHPHGWDCHFLLAKHMNAP